MRSMIMHVPDRRGRGREATRADTYFDYACSRPTWQGSRSDACRYIFVREGTSCEA